MSEAIFQQLLALFVGVGYFVGVIWSMTTKDGPYTLFPLPARFAGSVIAAGPAGAIFFGAIYAMLWLAVRILYFSITGQWELT